RYPARAPTCPRSGSEQALGHAGGAARSSPEAKRASATSALVGQSHLGTRSGSSGLHVRRDVERPNDRRATLAGLPAPDQEPRPGAADEGAPAHPVLGGLLPTPFLQRRLADGSRHLARWRAGGPI